MKKIHINEPKSYKGHSLILLLLLNIFDGLITYIGLEFGFYQEMNVLVNNIYNCSSNLFLLIKVIIPTAILILLVLNIKDKANIKNIPFQACEMSAGLNSICEAIEIER